ncbi:hypothetical protein [Dictyobacter formicarum]|uniref:Uncharacterized protein n=1 Tax=Dictyobacter formicarum TaxID=2778368 RepID=A0ABQ3VVG8_9CHLR|nr:hypothetical protein [Dictyobacter formicarum]GHO89801.1 hypothetical protein KSZ_78070 [Dictyobacter formicarum]GHO89818.1 hypothetical protein KSZ_78240 [Dictyobacter formicarum]
MIMALGLEHPLYEGTVSLVEDKIGRKARTYTLSRAFNSHDTTYLAWCCGLLT